MELNQLTTVEAHETGAECQILSPVDRKPTDVYIKVMGADSRAWRDAKKKQMSKMIQLRSQDKTEIDYDAMDVDALISVTIDWRGITQDGKPFECNDKNKKQLYKNSPFIVEQLLAFLSKGENFING